MMDKTNFELKVDVGLPTEGVKLRGEKLEELYDKHAAKKVEELLDFKMDTGDPEMGVIGLNPKAKSIALKIKNSVLEQLKKINTINSGSGVSIAIKNNPRGNPLLTINLRDGTSVPVPLDKESGDFLRETLRASIILPELSRENPIERFSAYLILNQDVVSLLEGKKIEQRYWSASYIRSLWYQNLGRGSEKSDRMMTLKDKDIFTDFAERYLEKGGEVKDSDLIDTSRTHY